MLSLKSTIYKYIRIPIYTKRGVGVPINKCSLKHGLVPLSDLAPAGREAEGGGGGGWAHRSQATISSRCCIFATQDAVGFQIPEFLSIIYYPIKTHYKAHTDTSEHEA
jgi:hypothetical protein